MLLRKKNAEFRELLGLVPVCLVVWLGKVYDNRQTEVAETRQKMSNEACWDV